MFEGRFNASAMYNNTTAFLLEKCYDRQFNKTKRGRNRPDTVQRAHNSSNPSNTCLIFPHGKGAKRERLPSLRRGRFLGVVEKKVRYWPGGAFETDFFSIVSELQDNCIVNLYCFRGTRRPNTRTSRQGRETISEHLRRCVEGQRTFWADVPS